MKLVLVIETEINDDDYTTSGKLMDKVRPIFVGDPNVKVHLGIRHIAEEVVSIFERDPDNQHG